MGKDGTSKAANAAIQAAKLAKAAAMIAKGTAAGGPYGAAAGAALSILPALIKPILYSLLGLLLLMFIIFYSIPSSLYVFESDDPQLQTINNKAMLADALYARFGQLAEEEADGFLGGISTDGYDEVSIVRQLEFIGPEWITAICSVLYEQDLDAVNDASLRPVAKSSLEICSNVETWEEEVVVEPPDSTDAETSSEEASSGDASSDTDSSEPETTTVTRSRLTVTLRSLSADQLMDKLGFDTAQKEWTHFLYDNLTQSQYVGPGEGGPSVGDLGDITFTDGVTPVVYYNQQDDRWGSLPYGAVDTIAEAACGPTSLAMAVSSLTGTTITPPEMAEWAYRKGYCIPHGGSYLSLIPEGAKYYGLHVESASTGEAQKIVDALSSGKLVISIMGPGHFTRHGHFLVLRGVTADGKILVADSFSVDNSNKEWDLSTILSEVKSGGAADGPFWILSVQ